MRTEPLLDVPIQGKPDIVPAYQSGAYRALQLTHLEQKAVVPVGDKALGLRALSPVRSQCGFDCHRNVPWEDTRCRARRDLVIAAFLPVAFGTVALLTGGNTVFQSFFMLTTVQPFATASSQPLSNCWSLSARS